MTILSKDIVYMLSLNNISLMSACLSVHMSVCLFCNSSYTLILFYESWYKSVTGEKKWFRN